MSTTFPLHLATMEYCGWVFYLGRVRIQTDQLGVAEGWCIGRHGNEDLTKRLAIITDRKNVPDILKGWGMPGGKAYEWASHVMLNWTADDN